MSLSEQSATLIQLLPIIREYHHKRVVIKYGGSSLDNEYHLDKFLQQIALLHFIGVHIFLLHGGGKAISERMKQNKLETLFVNGLRVTSSESIKIVQSVLEEEIQPMLLDKLIGLGVHSYQVSGSKIFIATKHPPIVDEHGKNVDIGYVGEVQHVDLKSFQDKDLTKIPIISSLGSLENGEIVNINADIASTHLAVALQTSHLLFLSDVPGIFLNPEHSSTLIPHLTANRVEALIQTGVIRGGMIPKVKSAIFALQNGVKSVHLLGTQEPYSLIRKILFQEKIGTVITL